MGKVNQFITHVVPCVIRPLRVLWHEVISFIFMVLAVVAVPSAIRHVKEFDGSGDAVFRAAMPVSWIVIMGYFALSGFLKARKISKS